MSEPMFDVRMETETHTITADDPWPIEQVLDEAFPGAPQRARDSWRTRLQAMKPSEQVWLMDAEGNGWTVTRREDG